MNKKLVMLTIAFGIAAGVILYMMPAAAGTTFEPGEPEMFFIPQEPEELPVPGDPFAGQPQVPLSELAECESALGRMMETGGLYITKEATALQMVKDLQGIIRDKDAEIALLNKQVHHSTVKQ